METDGNGDTTAVYTNEPNEHGKVISQRRDGATSYHQFDGQGSTRELTNASETVTDTYTYKAFGETSASSGATTHPFRYVGRLGYYHDSETSDYYVRARTYAPATGRFISPDSVGFAAGDANLYRYVDNNPTTFSDPSGLTPVETVRPPKETRDNNGCCIVTRIRMICRSMPKAYHLPGMTHCYMVFENEDGKAVDVLSGQGIEGNPKTLGLSDFFWDNNYFTGVWSANQTEYPVVVPVGASLCGIYDCMRRAAERMHAQSEYNQYTNNSNTFFENDRQLRIDSEISMVCTCFDQSG